MLFAALYDNDLDTPSMQMAMLSVSNIDISWAMHGGVQDYSLLYHCAPDDAYTFFRDYVGYRLIIADQYLDAPVADGFIYTATIVPAGVQLGCRGFWARHFDTYYVQTVNDAWTTAELIKDALTNNVTVLSDSQHYIDDPGTVVGFWEPPDEGIFPGDLIQKMAALSDSSNNQWNYWVQHSPFNGTTPQKPLAYFQAQVNDGTFSWQVWKRMLMPGGPGLARDISRLANDVQVIYTDSDGLLTITAAGTDTYSQGTYWAREAHLSLGDVPAIAATQYRDLHLNKYKDPMLTYNFTIGGSMILDEAGQYWPLWSVIKEGGGYMRCADIFPTATMFSESWDRLRVGQIMEARYSSSNNTLQISLDQESNAVDALLARIETFG